MGAIRMEYEYVDYMQRAPPVSSVTGSNGANLSFDDSILSAFPATATTVRRGNSAPPPERRDGAMSTHGQEYEMRTRRVSKIGSAQWLHDETVKRRQSLQAIRKQEEERRYEECTFKPRINTAPNTKHTTGSLFDRLSRNMAEVWKERDKRKQEAETEERNECTFQPQLSAKTQEYTSHVDTHQDKATKLYQDVFRYRERHNQRVVEKSVQELEGMFRPQITSSSPPNRKPIHERLGELRRQKENHMQKLRDERWNSEELTFQPTICATSRALDSEARNRSRAGSEKCQAMLAVKRHLQHMEGLQAAPSVSRKSRELAEANEDYQQHRDFVQRMQWQAKKRANKLRMQSEHQEEAQAVKLSQKEIEASLKRMEERERKAKAKLEQVAEQVTEGMFKPQVLKRNETRSGSRRRSVDSLSHPKLHCNHEMKLRDQIKEEEKECTYKPRINRKSLKMAEKHRGCLSGYGRNTEKLREAEQRKQQRLMEESEECTFRPAITHRRSSKPPRPPVPGMVQYLELRNTARKVQEEKKRREEEAHKVKPSAIAAAQRRDLGGKLCTIPQPFRLSTGTGHHSCSEPLAPFRPQTNDRRDVLQRLLNSDAGYECEPEDPYVSLLGTKHYDPTFFEDDASAAVAVHNVDLFASRQ
eukprot:Sspe_Gene.3350::Locus_1105_Transcript_1_1_Confidence_1.000_Length_2273::g.3350::m.3350